MNNLPAIDKQAETLTKPIFSRISLGVAPRSSNGDKWAHSWNDNTGEFKRTPYGIGADGHK
ncbi:hypothetical protein ABBQ32_004588 [Trebouxia sp. C0010 RCD-2024]